MTTIVIRRRIIAAAILAILLAPWLDTDMRYPNACEAHNRPAVISR